MLQELLVWGSTIGAAIIAYAIMAGWPWVQTLGPKAKRRLSIVLTAGIALAFWAGELAMGYAPMPGPWREWVEAAVAIAGGSFGLSQFIHGERELGTIKV